MPRIFQQLGHGYGPSPTTIVVQIDGTTVFSGPVPTADEPVPGEDLAHNYGVLCFDWTESDTYFAGEKTLSIAVTNGVFKIGETLAQSSNVDPTAYGSIYKEALGNLLLGDPLTNVVIDGVSRSRPEQAPLLGQWGWVLAAGSSLSATMRVNILPANSYIVFNSAPTSMAPGATATLNVSIPQIDPNKPLPQTYGWRVANDTTVDTDFAAMTGNVEFTSQDSAFAISTTNTATAGTFQIWMLDQSGNLIGNSNMISIA